jgi:hypothetical protein
MPGAPKYDPIVEPIVPPSPREGCTGRCEVDAIEDVEHLDAELRIDPLVDWGVLKESEIDIGEAWIVELVAALRAVGAGSRIDKDNRIEPLDCATDDGMGDTCERMVMPGARLARSAFSPLPLEFDPATTLKG